MTRESLITWASDSQRVSDATDIYLDAEPDHRPGDIILTCKPFVHIITDCMKGRVCDLCLRADRMGKPLRCCSECGQVYFCNSCLASPTPSIFKAIHLLECSHLSRYSSILSNSTKLFLRFYWRITEPESIPHQTYYNPINKEEITFESLVPRLIYNSKDELIQHITNFCEKHSLKVNDDFPLDDHETKFSIQKLLFTDDITVEEIAIFQFINLLNELNRCENLLSLIQDDNQIYRLWIMFVRLWSYTVPITDESVVGLFCSDPIAYGLYLEPSVIVYGNSCLPNCALAYYGNILQLRAMKSIFPGQNLSLSYVDISANQSERAKELHSFFISDCYCDRCGAADSKEKINFKLFNSIKHEFVSTYNESLIPALNLSMNLSTLLNYTSSSLRSIGDDTSKNEHDECRRLHEMCLQLYDYYEQIYPNNHPEKSRFLFAYMSIEMNLLLFKLSGGDQPAVSANEKSSPKSSESKRLSDCSDFSLTNSQLDSLVNDINQWSQLLNSTVRSIRWTHGIDHTLFNVMPIPLFNCWSFKGKSLTLAKLHSDPMVLLRILRSSSGGTLPNYFFRKPFEHLTNQLKQVLGDKNVDASPKSSYCANGSNSFYCATKIAFRTVLIIFAVLFPLFIYYSIYVSEF